MKKNKKTETSEMPEDFNYANQIFHLEIKAVPDGPKENDSIQTDIKCKAHGTQDFIKSAIHGFLSDDPMMFELFKNVITDILLDEMIANKSYSSLMGQRGEA